MENKVLNNKELEEISGGVTGNFIYCSSCKYCQKITNTDRSGKTTYSYKCMKFQTAINAPATQTCGEALPRGKAVE